MEVGLTWVATAAGLIPWVAALRSNWRLPLRYALMWAIIAWLAWGAALATQGKSVVYAALTLSGCAGVAVFGARRPGAAAWNFVVVGLLAILLLPVAEGAVTGAIVQLDTIRIFFLIGLLGTLICNYVLTRLGLAAMAFASASALALGRVAEALPADLPWSRAAESIALLSVPWAGWWAIRGSNTELFFANRLWGAFRDRFGAIWALRVMEQFNRSAVHNNSNSRLSWRGAMMVDDGATERLQALLQRFGMSTL